MYVHHESRKKYNLQSSGFITIVVLLSQELSSFFITPRHDCKHMSNSIKEEAEDGIDFRENMIMMKIFLVMMYSTGAMLSNLEADLARGLVCDVSAVTQSKHNGGDLFSKHAEDCAALYLSGSTFNGIYEIWPREGLSTSDFH
jgi:hypothetical protein